MLVAPSPHICKSSHVLVDITNLCVEPPREPLFFIVNFSLIHQNAIQIVKRRFFAITESNRHRQHKFLQWTINEIC